MNAFVLGRGYVGKATMKSLGITKYFTRTESNITLEEGAKLKFCFICLPTITDDKGSQDESRKVIHDYIQQISGYNKEIIFVVRSTVLPGTCKALSEEFKVTVCDNPELLSEDTWEEDAVKPKMIIIGADDESSKNELIKVWEKVKCGNRVVTDTVTSETIKYTFNTWFATKVVFANQLYDTCKSIGANYQTVKYALHQHPWGAKHHMTPIHKNGRGAGGRCLPKDLKAFTAFSNSEFLKTVQKINDDYLKGSNKT